MGKFSKLEYKLYSIDKRVEQHYIDQTNLNFHINEVFDNLNKLNQKLLDTTQQLSKDIFFLKQRNRVLENKCHANRRRHFRLKRDVYKNEDLLRIINWLTLGFQIPPPTT